MPSESKVVNITRESSAEGLRELLEEEANRRGMLLRPFIGEIYSYAVNNKSTYASQLQQSRPKPGQHIGAVVNDHVYKELKKWAQERSTSRGRLCCFILEKTLENGLLDDIFHSD